MPTATFLGHACVLIESDNHHLIIDPFLTGNPQAERTADDITADHVLLTHGHADHVGDAFAIAKRCNATVVACFELANLAAREGCTVHPMHQGGAWSFPFGRVKMTIAFHGGGYGPDDVAPIYTGPPSGLLITIGDRTIYHAGDTALFSDMKLIGDDRDIDVAFLPIGDNFTMGIDDAARAVEFLRPKHVVPIHYNTWPYIEVDPHAFAAKVNGAEVHVLGPGQSIEV